MFLQPVIAVHSGRTAGFEQQGMAQCSDELRFQPGPHVIFNNNMDNGQCRCQLQSLLILIQNGFLLLIELYQLGGQVLNQELQENAIL